MLNQAKITISVIFWVVAGMLMPCYVFAIDYLPITSSSGGNKKQADQGGLAFIKPQQDNYNNAIGANKNVLLATPYCFPSAKGSNSNLLGAGTPVNPQIATPSADSKASFSPATNGNTSDGTSTPYVSGDPLSIPTSTCKSNQQKANSTPQTLPISQSLSALGLKASNSVVFFDKKSGVSFGEKKINAKDKCTGTIPNINLNNNSAGKTNDAGQNARQKQFERTQYKTTQEQGIVSIKAKIGHSGNNFYDQAQSVMAYQKLILITNQTFKNKTQINSITNKTKYNAETLYNAVSGIMPYLKNGLINQPKILTAHENVDLRLPPLKEPINKEPANTAEKAESYKQPNLDPNTYSGIDIYLDMGENRNLATENIKLIDEILKQTVNYSKTGLSPPGSSDITNSINLSWQLSPIFIPPILDISCYKNQPSLTQTESKPHINRIIAPPMGLQGGIPFIGNVLPGASFNLTPPWPKDGYSTEELITIPEAIFVYPMAGNIYGCCIDFINRAVVY